MAIIIQFVFYFLLNFSSGGSDFTQAPNSIDTQERQLIVEDASYELTIQESILTEYYGLLTEVEVTSKLPTYILFRHSFNEIFNLSSLTRKIGCLSVPHLRDFPEQGTHLPVYILFHSLRIPPLA